MAPPYTSANLQRVGFLTAVPGLLAALNVDVQSVLRASGIPANALDDPEATIPYRSMGKLLECAAERSARPHFGILLGKLIHTGSLGLLANGSETCPHCARRCRPIAENQHRNSHGSVLYLLEAPDEAFLGYAIYEPDMQGGQEIIDVAVTAMFQVISELSEQDRRHLDVMLSRRTPGDRNPYREVFGGEIHFEAGQSGVVLPRGLLDRPIPHADPERLKTLTTAIPEAMARGQAVSHNPPQS